MICKNGDKTGKRVPLISSEIMKKKQEDDDGAGAGGLGIDELESPSVIHWIQSVPLEPVGKNSELGNGTEDEVELQDDDSNSMVIKHVEKPLGEVVSGREKLKRHRIEVAGRVWIPDIWGQEELLKDWIDCSAFDASLVPAGIMSARAALMEEGRRSNSNGLRIENRC